jgi:phage/plasmid-like protein (TIGR03299 family)
MSLKYSSQLSTIGTAYEGETPNELAQKAGLDWNVVVTPANYTVREAPYQSSLTNIIVREDKPEIQLGDCGTKWKPLQNVNILESVIEFCKDSPTLKLDRVGCFKNGKTIWASIQTDKIIELKGGDLISGKLLLINSHVYANGMLVKLLLDRTVCFNQLVLGVQTKTKVYAHSKFLDQSKVMSMLAGFHNQFTQFKEDAELLSNTAMDLDLFYRLVIKEFGNIEKMNHIKAHLSDLDEQPKAVKQIVQLYLGAGLGSSMISAYNTQWGALNSVTQYVNYNSKKTGGVEGHINSLWLESKARKQQNVYKQLVSLSRV